LPAATTAATAQEWCGRTHGLTSGAGVNGGSGTPDDNQEHAEDFANDGIILVQLGQQQNHQAKRRAQAARSDRVCPRTSTGLEMGTVVSGNSQFH